MFIFSIKASTIKLITVIGASVIALVILLTMIPVYEPNASSLMYSSANSYNYTNVKTNDDRLGFLTQFGWAVDSEPLEERKVTIPSEFDRIFICYNDLQRQQGLDLAKYKNKDVMRYTYKINNYPDYDGTVYANIIVYRGKVIGGDVCRFERLF